MLNLNELTYSLEVAGLIYPQESGEIITIF